MPKPPFQSLLTAEWAATLVLKVPGGTVGLLKSHWTFVGNIGPLKGACPMRDYSLKKRVPHPFNWRFLKLYQSVYSCKYDGAFKWYCTYIPTLEENTAAIPKM